MATPRIEIAPERIADGRRLYETTLTPVGRAMLRSIAAVCQELGLSQSSP